MRNEGVTYGETGYLRDNGWHQSPRRATIALLLGLDVHALLRPAHGVLPFFVSG